MYEGGVLRVSVSRFSKCARQLGMQARRFKWVAERLGNKQAARVVPAPFYACALFHNFRYAKKDKDNNQYGKDLLVNPRLPNVKFQENEICTENHLVVSSSVVLIATKTISVSEKFYANYHKTEFASSVQLE